MRKCFQEIFCLRHQKVNTFSLGASLSHIGVESSSQLANLSTFPLVHFMNKFEKITSFLRALAAHEKKKEGAAKRDNAVAPARVHVRGALALVKRLANVFLWRQMAFC